MDILINDKKYILFEIDAPMSMDYAKRIDREIKRDKGIVTYYKIRGALFGFGNPLLRIKYLIPEDNVLKHCKIKYP